MTLTYDMQVSAHVNRILLHFKRKGILYYEAVACKASSKRPKGRLSGLPEMALEHIKDLPMEKVGR